MIARLLHCCRLLFFDPRCRVCGQQLVFHHERCVCGDCLRKVKPMRGPICLRCGKMLNDHGELCGDCMLRPPVFNRNISYGLYEGGLRDLILLYKYADLRPLSRLLGELLLELYRDNMAETEFDCILTVPPDPGRKREFDHLALLGMFMARQTGIPFYRRVLVKRRTTEPQSRLSSSQRRRNLDGAFGVKRPHRVGGKSVLLLDDVFTTGTTITRCVELLNPLDADVTVLTLARSV